ncbi:MAG: thrombospondin type 3 repeat-containing protein [Thermoleophilaceae bacterium]
MKDSRISGRFAALLAVAALASAPAALAASVDPTFSAGNPQCSDFGLIGLNIDSPKAGGQHSDGTLTVSIVQTQTAGPIVSWSSNIGVDSVIVKGGNGSGGGGDPGSNVYTYSPESTGDSNLVPPNGTGLSHVEFCYDTGDDNPPPQTCAEQNATSPDTDDDGVVDACDNCPTVMNSDQTDSDSNGVGDACEPSPPPPTCSEQNASSPDSDGDGIVDACDNCPAVANSDQADTNGNGMGDACEESKDGSPPLDDNPPPAGPDTTPPPGDQPAGESAPADEGGQAVLGERVSSANARLMAATGCASRPFTARVTGNGVARVVFVLDGKRLAAVGRPNSKGAFTLRINPARYRVGVHRLVATVEFKASTRTSSRKLRASFQRCARRLIAPRFTG